MKLLDWFVCENSVTVLLINEGYILACSATVKMSLCRTTVQNNGEKTEKDRRKKLQLKQTFLAYTA